MLCTSLSILDVLTRRDPSSPVNSTALWASDWPPKWGLILQYTLMLSEPHENSKYNTFSGTIIKDLVFFQNSVIPTSSIRNSCDQVICKNNVLERKKSVSFLLIAYSVSNTQQQIKCKAYKVQTLKKIIIPH